MTYKTIKPINKTFFYIFSILVLIMINYRGVTVDKTLGKLTDCLGCYKYWIISVDSRVAIFAFVILLFGFFSKTYLIRTSARLFTCESCGRLLISPNVASELEKSA